MTQGTPDPGRLLVGLGVVIALVGLGVMAAGKLGLGKLPGDIVVRRGNFTFYFPLVTSILLSVLLTLVLRFLSKR